MSNLTLGSVLVSPVLPDAATDDQIKGTAKWLVGSSGAVVAVMVAGMQLGDVGRLDGPEAVLALAAAGVALLAVGVFLGTAAKVLVAPRPSYDELRNLEIAEVGVRPDPLNEPQGSLLRHIVIDRRLELLGQDREFLVDLLTERAALTRFFAGSDVELAEATRKPAVPADVDFMTRRSDDVEARTDRILAAAALWHTRKRFDALFSPVSVVLLAFVFVAGIAAFGYLTTRPAAPTVEEPTVVEIHLPDSGSDVQRLDLPEACAGQVLDGIALSGTWAEPVLATEGSDDCAPSRFVADDTVLVLPDVSGSAAGLP